MVALIQVVLTSRTMICYLLAILLLSCTSLSNNNSNTSIPEDNSQDTKSSAPRIEESGLEIEDGGFLSGEPCAPPCFWKIVPGVTLEVEVIQILQAKGLFQECEAYNNEAQSGSRGLSCHFIVGISFGPGTDIVDSVGFRPSQKITVEDVIAKYGEPNAVYVGASSIPEDPRTTMILYYDNIKTRLSLPEQAGTTFEVEPSTQIENVGYFDTTSYRGSLRDVSPVWQGYGEYQQNEPQ